MTMGPEPIRRILRRSVRRGMGFRTRAAAGTQNRAQRREYGTAGGAGSFPARRHTSPKRERRAERSPRWRLGLVWFPALALGACIPAPGGSAGRLLAALAVGPARRPPAARGRLGRGALPARAVVLEVAEDVPLVVEVIIAAAAQLGDGLGVA